MSKTIAISGLGWLGIPLAQHLMTLGYPVKGSATTLEKATTLQKKGFNAYEVEISENGISGSISPFLKDVTVLVIMISTGLRRNTGNNYVLKMKHFLTEIEKAGIPKVIFVSSTSVYSDAQGKVNEKDLPNPETEAGRQIAAAERLFFNAPSLQTSIVRFGGLFGGSREPARYLAGRTELRDGNAPVNLIHRDDCIGILSEIMKQDAFGRIFNAVAPQHPTKSDYYTRRALLLGLVPPSFSNENEEVFKQVDSENIEVVLKYTFKRSLE